MPTWKACPAVLDVLGTGYTYKTPCDIEFAEDAAGNIHAKVLDEQHKIFLQDREPMPQFFHPSGYHRKHFAWWADWAVELPAGYSALYTHPLNRFELPFLTTSGVVDNDKVHLPGTMPFFVLKGVRGILPAGTRTRRSSRSSERLGIRDRGLIGRRQDDGEEQGKQREVSPAGRWRLPARSVGTKKVPIKFEVAPPLASRGRVSAFARPFNWPPEAPRPAARRRPCTPNSTCRCCPRSRLSRGRSHAPR